MDDNTYTARVMNFINEVIKPTNKKVFAESIGLNKQKYGHIERGENKIPIEAVVRLLDMYPQINAEFIFTGKGTILKDVELSEQYKELLDKAQSELEFAYDEIDRLKEELKKLNEYVNAAQTK